MLGERLKQLREQKNLTQQELADALNISRGTYAHYEINRREPDDATKLRIADFFAVTVDYLLGREIVTKDHPNPEIADLLRDHGIKKLQLMANYTVEDVKRLVELGELLRNKKQGT
jgi:transcriptional regulator with XRE-family HTH domain